MTILEALKNGNIRYAGGRYFDATTRASECLYAETIGEVADLIKANAESYKGGAFVHFDEELPAGVPTGAPEHTWAFALQVGANRDQVGAVVIWSDAENESAWRAGRPESLSFDDFNVRRQGE